MWKIDVIYDGSELERIICSAITVVTIILIGTYVLKLGF